MTTRCERRMNETLEWKCIAVGSKCVLEIAINSFDVNKCKICEPVRKGLKLR